MRASRNASSSSGVPMVTRRQPSRRGHDAKLRTSTARSSSACHVSSPLAIAWAGTARSWRPTATRRPAARPSRPTSRPRSSTRWATRVVHLGDVVEGDGAGELVERVEVVGQHDLVELLDHPCGARRGSRAGPRPSTTSSSRCGSPPAAGRRSPSPAPTTARTARRPRRRRAARRARRASSRTAATVSSSSTMPVGLLGEQRKATDGSASAKTRRTSSRSIEKSAARSPTATAVPTTRAMCACKRVGRLPDGGGASGAAVGEQQRLQHLVRPVGREDLLGRDAVQRGDARRAARRAVAVGIAVPHRSPATAASDRAPATRAAADTGDSLVLRRTSTSTCGEW